MTDLTERPLVVSSPLTVALDPEAVRTLWRAWEKLSPFIPEGCDPLYTNIVDNGLRELWRVAEHYRRQTDERCTEGDMGLPHVPQTPTHQTR